MNIIDPHIHLFNLKQGEYTWLKMGKPPFWPNKKIIAKTFSEQDLRLSDKLTLAGFIHIEAGFDNSKPWREIAYLEQQCHLPFRSIAFIDLLLCEQVFLQQLTRLIAYKSVIGCRYILDHQATEILTSPRAINNLGQLAQHNLLFEVQMPLSDLSAVKALAKLLARIPELKVIINHAGSPLSLQTNDNKSINSSSDLWLTGLKQLGQMQNCFIKCSGWEMIEQHYSTTAITKIIQICLQYFGEQRVMLASNFPLCMFSKSYQHYWQETITALKTLELTAQQQNLLCYENAKNCYQFTNLTS